MSALIIENLTKVYATGTVALKGVSFKVAEKDFFALLGPNGAGKSTTIGIITSLITKTGGKVRVFGHDLDTDPASVKKSIGLVPQEFNFNIFDKVQGILVKQAGFYGIEHDIALKRSKKYLERLGLWDKRDSQARHLSGGQKRRLMIARALVHEPPLLILDEPTAGVDIELRREMWQFLKDINDSGTTIILTTHYLEEAENLCKHIGIIHHGELIENSSMKHLLQKLHVETFILNLAKPVETAPDIQPFVCRFVDETTLEVDILEGQVLNALFKALSERGIVVASMRNKVNRLEELFIRLTRD